MKSYQPSILSDNGSIALSIPLPLMTWHQFLHVSRAANSKVGGWNSRTYWRTRGLSIMVKEGVAADFIANWTRDSLASADPKPRTKDFRILARQKALAEGRRTLEGNPKEQSENHHNWQLAQWLFQNSCSRVPSGVAPVVTYELPLAAESSGQLKADVVVFGVHGHVEIVELKKSGVSGNPDSPLMALVEAICYSLHLIRCWDMLKKELPERIKRMHVPDSIGIVLAGPNYWEHCNGKGQGITEDAVRSLHAIVESVQGTIRAYLSQPAFGLTLTLADIAKTGAGELEVAKIEGVENLFPPKSVFAECKAICPVEPARILSRKA